MNKYQKILAVIDPSSENQKALKRSIELAKLSGATITAFLSIYDFSYEMTSMLSQDEREAMRQSVIDDRKLWLTELIETLNTQNVSIDCLVVWHNRPFEPIIDQVINNGFDIIIKSTHEHSKLKSVIFTPTDWHLLRKCPCPVLLVKDHLWPNKGNIIAAVNICSDEPSHLSLNQEITTQAKALANFINSHVHLVNSYPGTPVNISIEIPEFNISEYNENMCNHHEKAMHKHAAKHNIDSNHCHVIEGLPEDVIEQVSSQLDAELVVMGTIGRTGLSATLIGNTAEHVIDNLNCDLLALKPLGYVSPLQK